MKHFLLFVFILFPFCSKGLVIVPISIEKQLESSNAVVHGVYLGKNYKKLANGEVVTELSLKVIGAVGLRPSELINRNNFKIMFSGGVYQGLNFIEPNAPGFRRGEEVVLLMNKSKYGFILNQLSLGKYSVFYEKGRAYLSNEAFPAHKKLGKIEYSKFEDKVYSIFGSAFSKTGDDFHISRNNLSGVSGKNGFRKGRNPANSGQGSDTGKESRLSMFWLIIIFSFLGSFSIISVRSRD